MAREYEIINIHKTNSTIAASSNHLTFDYKTSPTECAELVSLEVVPDINGAGNVSNLDYCEIEIDDSALWNSKYSVNWFRNQLPFADKLGKRPEFKFGIPWTKDPLLNTTIKMKSDQKLGVRFYADSTGVTRKYDVVATIIVYSSDRALREKYGSQYPVAIDYTDRTVAGQDVNKTSSRVVEVLLNNFDLLPGGYNQSRPKILPFNRFKGNLAATTPNEFVEPDSDFLSFRVDPKEVFILQSVAVSPHANSKQTWVSVDQTFYPRKYPWPTADDINALPFGGHTSEHGPKFFRPGSELIVKGQKFETKIKDNGTAIPINGQYTALLGKWIWL